MKSKEEKRQRRALNLFFSLVIFGILLVSVMLATGISALLLYFGVYPYETIENAADSSSGNAYHFMLLMMLISLVIGCAISFFTSKFPLKPINRLVSRMNRLASGDYEVRLNSSDLLSNYPAFRSVSDSFNKLARELQNTEMLRSDFINNFSHEFKTPIVSIAGFAKLLKHGNLTDEQQKEYLTIIEEESMRLSYMATNVLNLTKVENQMILTDVTEYNVSEQLRGCVLLLEDKWSKKNIDLDMEFGEYTIAANEELLKQVWINLIDNAAKFTPDFGTITLNLSKTDDHLRIVVQNTGSEIPQEKLDKIWRKFYQADESHSHEGNGVGLAVVKKIVELHNGTVSVRSEHQVTAFTVELPVRL